jgi:hypothetical protein
MSSYALLGALSGFRYSAVEKTVWLGPRVKTRPFECFFSTASGFGTIALRERAVSIRIIEGELVVEKIVIAEGEGTRSFEWKITVRPDAAGSKEIS